MSVGYEWRVWEPRNRSILVAQALQRLEHLQVIAKQANAASLVTFLSGLQNFLSLMAQRRVNMGGQRLQSVEGRILAMARMVDGWIEKRTARIGSDEPTVPAT